MKRILLIATSLLLAGCTTAELQTAETIAKPIALAAASAAGAYLGVPPTATQAGIVAFNSLWGAVAQVQAGQPASAGAVAPAIGNAIQAAIPAGATSKTQLAVLAAAASLVQPSP